MTSKARALRALRWGALLLLAGALYVGLVRFTGRGLGCPIYAATGLYCPGCGVSRLFLSLLRLDFSRAFRANRLLFVTLPLMGALLGARVWRYVRRGSLETPRWEERTWLALAGAFVLFGILRNLPGLGFLAPR